MGYGAVLSRDTDVGDDVDYVDEPPADFSDQDFWRWVESATQWDLLDVMASPLANSLAIVERETWHGRGLPTFAELGEAALGDDHAGLRFALSAGRRVAPARQAGQVLRFEPALAGGELGAVSAAEAYYQRPGARADGRRELPNLFHPYWHPRLVAASDDERRRALALQEAR